MSTSGQPTAELQCTAVLLCSAVLEELRVEPVPLVPEVLLVTKFFNLALLGWTKSTSALAAGLKNVQCAFNGAPSALRDSNSSGPV